MSENIFAAGNMSEEESRTERAQRAVRAFRALQPGLTGYARAITGIKNIEVVLSEGIPRTDGRKIMYKPPIELGDLTPHQRMKCERRDRKTLLMLCPACRVREKVLASIYHEIGHIHFGTFEEVKGEVVAGVLDQALTVSGGRYAKNLKKNWDMVPQWKKNDYLNLSSLISPYLPILVNALEDARVDEAMFRARKGMRVMFDALMMEIFREGIQKEDGTFDLWSTRPLNSQALIGVFVLATGYDFEGWFDPIVEEALKDEKLQTLVNQIDTIRSAEGTYSLAFPILARLRELGFCKTDEDPEDEEPEQPQEPEENPQEEEETEDGEEGPEDGTDQDQGEDSGGSEADEDGGDSGAGGDPEEGADAGDGADSDADSSDEDGADGSASQPDASGAGSDDGPSEGDEEASGDLDGGHDDEGDRESDDVSADEDEAAGSGGGASDDEPGERDQSGGSGQPDEESEGDGESSGGGSGDGLQGPSDRTEGDSSGGDGESGHDDEPGPRDDTSSPGAEPGAGGESGDSGGVHPNGEASDDGTDADEVESDELRDEAPGELTDEEGHLGDQLREDDSSTDEELAGSDEPAEEGDPEVIDSGADEGKGGLDDRSEPDYGSHENVLDDFKVFTGHDDMFDQPIDMSSVEDDKAIDKAIIQGLYFEKPSANVIGVREHKYGIPYIEDGVDMSSAWEDIWSQHFGIRRGIKTDLDIPEQILGPALMQMRRTFEDNARADHQRNLRSGRVNSRVLGKRAPFKDDRLFTKKRLPGKRSYSALLGIDISGSTIGENLALAKRSAMAQATLLDRMGIEFSIFAHTANGTAKGVNPLSPFSDQGLMLDVYQIKGFDEPWAPQQKEALDKISSAFENLDGHGVEYYRKMIEKRSATDKLIFYYTDGKMPAANYKEELEILQREIAYCKLHKITLLGVGIRTDSPRRHGLDTVEVHKDEDISAVVRHLQTSILHNR